VDGRPEGDPTTGPDGETSVEDLAEMAMDAANFLKAFSHDGRLMILCYLVGGPRSVGELETLLSSRQAAVSQQLARLRMEGLVSARREAQTIYYSIRDQRVYDVLQLLKCMFCPPDGPNRRP
jgi:DNA-binding transcriptional ArsR family regulator